MSPTCARTCPEVRVKHIQEGRAVKGELIVQPGVACLLTRRGLVSVEVKSLDAKRVSSYEHEARRVAVAEKIERRVGRRSDEGVRATERTRWALVFYGRKRGTENAAADGCGGVETSAPSVNARVGTNERSRDGTVVVEG
jgi:hypothetical protein